MASRKKSWQERLQTSGDLPKVEPISSRMAPRWGTGTMLIPAPLNVDAVMKKVPRGKLITTTEIRTLLARRHGASITCPITTGIFTCIAAHAAEEAAAAGAKRITPYWRTLKAGGELNPKYPGGLERLSELLRKEGHAVVARGKRLFVSDYERCLPGELLTE